MPVRGPSGLASMRPDRYPSTSAWMPPIWSRERTLPRFTSTVHWNSFRSKSNLAFRHSPRRSSAERCLEIVHMAALTLEGKGQAGEFHPVDQHGIRRQNPLEQGPAGVAGDAAAEVHVAFQIHTVLEPGQPQQVDVFASMPRSRNPSRLTVPLNRAWQVRAWTRKLFRWRSFPS